MLMNSKKRIKAKQYKCITIDRENHRIIPVGTETETVEIDPVQLVVDFTALISEYAKCRHLMLYVSPLSYKDASSKKEQNSIANLNAHIFKEQALMIDALLAFVNKYGLFGIKDDNVLAYDYNLQDADGSFSICNYPVTAYFYRDSTFQVHSKPYEKYIESFFPGISASEAIKLDETGRACQYSEYVEDILQNRRILACTEYIAGIDKQSTNPLIIQNMNASLYFKDETPMYDIQNKSLIGYCHSMFFLNEIAGENKTVRICQYKRCHRPFTGKKAKYCCEACMRYANKAKKKGATSNG